MNSTATSGTVRSRETIRGFPSITQLFSETSSNRTGRKQKTIGVPSKEIGDENK